MTGAGLRERVVRRATRRYVAGPDLADALALAQTARTPTTLGFWDGPGDSPELVAATQGRAIAAIAATALDSYLSIKLPSLGEDSRADALAEAAAETGVLLHFDSLAETEAERTLALAVRLADGGAAVGATLPGCWSRSVRDAAVLAAAGVRIRIVKGQWPGDRDPRDGFLTVVDAVARSGGRAAIATHDARLAGSALARLPGAELELLLGLPAGPVTEAAGPGTPARIYIPFGRGYLPYAVRRTAARPITIWWLARDLALEHGRPHRSGTEP